MIHVMIYFDSCLLPQSEKLSALSSPSSPAGSSSALQRLSAIAGFLISTSCCELGPAVGKMLSQNGWFTWFIMDNLIETDDFGVRLLLEPSSWWYSLAYAWRELIGLVWYGSGWKHALTCCQKISCRLVMVEYIRYPQRPKIGVQNMVTALIRGRAVV